MNRLLLIFVLSLSTNSIFSQNRIFDNSISFADKQVKAMLNTQIINFNKICPVSWIPNAYSGKIIRTSIDDVASGYFAGCLWYLYQLTEDKIYLSQARKWSMLQEKNKDLTYVEYVGRMAKPSLMNASDIDKKQNFIYNAVLVSMAQNLSAMYDPHLNCLHSTSFYHNDIYDISINIASLLDLDLLFFAYRNTNIASQKNTYRNIAIGHANTVSKLLVRRDSTVADYYSFYSMQDTTTMSKAQAIAIYGFLNIYNETSLQNFLDISMMLADKFIANLPKDFIPNEYFVANSQTKSSKDATTAAILTSALFTLYQYTNNEKYLNTAINILKKLSTPEYSETAVAANGCFLLKHSIVDNNLQYGFSDNRYKDSPYILADYFFLESLVKYKNLGR
ncbi:glucuronyl hydrolase [Bacteroidia bacterium]|nr:glucuronyl hydrolase [Bacteroidia bacterium]